MRDWDNNDEMDYWDDVFYLENLEREYNHSDEIDLNDDFDMDDDFDIDDDFDMDGDFLANEFYAEDYSGGSSYNSSRSSTAGSIMNQIGTTRSGANRSISAGSSVSNTMYAKNSWEEKYGKPSQSKIHINGSFILSMIILLVVGSIIEAFCPPLAFALLVIWAIAEFSRK